MDYAVKIKDVSKTYFLYDKPSDRLKEVFSPFRKSHHREFHALNPLSVDIPRGGCFGVIGVNGSGKSTLLKMVTGVLTPTTGNIEIEGRVSALLELGAGFNLEYTGLENIYLNGTVMGYSKAEMDQKLPEILAFADIGDFIHQPVKTYSSGMFARLAFAVAINVDPDVLIVDEALSVGDIYFQSKCFKKFDEFKAKGKTIIFVTHDMGCVLRYCDEVMVLHKGDKVGQGNPHDMVDLYKKILANQFDANAPKKEEKKAAPEVKPGETMKSHLALNPKPIEYGEKQIEIVDFGIFDHKGQVTNTVLKDEIFTFKVALRFHEEIQDVISTITIKTPKGDILMGTNTFLEGVSLNAAKQGDTIVVSYKQKCQLQPGEYLISTSATKYIGDEVHVYHRLYDVVGLDVIGTKATVGYFDPDSQIETEVIKG